MRQKVAYDRDKVGMAWRLESVIWELAASSPPDHPDFVAIVGDFVAMRPDLSRFWVVIAT